MLSNYRLYVSNNCGGCRKVLMLLNQENISVKTINVDHENYTLPFPLLVFPALIKNEKLVGYGAKDIIAHLIVKTNYKQGKL